MDNDCKADLNPIGILDSVIIKPHQYRMDIRSLACFVAVAEDLHFRKAAERLNLTQPALSQRIRVLEEEIGTALFARDRRRVALTAAGAAFLDPARAAVASANLAKTRALRAVQGEIGRLRLGFTVIAFYGVLPEAVRLFRNQYPEIAVELAEMNSPALEHALAAGTIDLGILHPPITAPELTIRTLPSQKLKLALPASHRLADRDILTVPDLDKEPLLIAPRAIGPNIYDRIIALFQNQGVSPHIVQEVTPMTTLVGLVAAGVGVGFVTEGIAAVGRPGVVFRSIEPEPPDLPIAAAWLSSNLSSSAIRFLDIVAQYTGENVAR